MGFCRRCGDIVVGPRCKCGGTSVAPVVQWNKASAEQDREDKWSRTYTRDKPAARSSSRGPPSSTAVEADSSTPTRRFPRPRSSTVSATVTLDTRVSAHIASYQEPSRIDRRLDDPPSPVASDIVQADILHDPETFELSKAYGSVLQPKETLQTFACAICMSPFPPDATIYPDPSSPSLTADSGGRFLCRPCFIVNGGSKGDCYGCHKPVLILKREGGFVETSNRVYHKQCYRCEGCFKNIGDNPMVDLLGRPSCASCFDTCLTRQDDARLTPHNPPKEPEEKYSNIGGYAGGRTPGDVERKAIPALEELEQRLGIRSKTREGSPVVETPVRRHITGDLPDSKKTVSRLSIGADNPVSRVYERFKSEGPGTFQAPSDDDAPLRYSERYKDSRQTASRASLSKYEQPKARDSALDEEAKPFRYSDRYRKDEQGAPRSSLGSESAASFSANKHRTEESTTSRPSTDGDYLASRSFDNFDDEKPFTSRSSLGGGSSFSRSSERFKTPEPTTPGSRRKSFVDGTSSSKPTEDAIEEMKRRFMRTSISSSEVTDLKPASPVPDSPSQPPLSTRDYIKPILKSRSSTPSLSSVPVVTSSIDVVHAPTPERMSGVGGPVTARSLGLRSKSSMSTLSTDIERSVNTPELVSDFSDSNTQSSGATTPPIANLSLRKAGNDQTPTKTRASHNSTTSTSTSRKSALRSQRSLENLRIPAPLSPETKCARCQIPLFTTNGGKFVTVPEEPTVSGSAPKVYHSDCFRCSVCDGMFAASNNGQAIFVRSAGGPCHVECAPPKTVKTRTWSTPARPVFKSDLSSTESSYASSVSSGRFGDTSSIETSSTSDRLERFDRGPQTAGPTTSSFPRFGGPNHCPGCAKSVSVMERGVVPGPQSTRWHATCLVCGGQEARGRNGRRINGRPGCGKKLDSAAKSDGEGGVWCRECLLILPASLRSNSPVKSVSAAPDTGSSPWSNRSSTPGTSVGRISQQFTGTTTIARQETGRGDVPGSDSEGGIPRQVTGGALNPTHQLGLQGLARQHTGGASSGVRAQFTGGDSGVRSHHTGGDGVRTHYTGGDGVRTHYTGGDGVRTHCTGGDGIRTHHTGGGGIRIHTTGGDGVRTHYTGGSSAAVRSHLTGGTSGAIRTQLTGGGSSVAPRTPVTRPKSVGGFRNYRNADEGRGMYLVKQLTDSTGAFSGNDRY